ncbi:MAG: 3-dehydroquinate synthase II [Candidatus Aureabacteria bacterium]|nr:3-dehydroquinate synthase II [Candidatus Auribacterota bacterium]
MKKIWVKAIPWNKDVVTAALESGADAVVVEHGRTAEVKKLGRIRTVAPDGDLKIGKDVVEIEMRGKADEERALRLSRDTTVVIRTNDWKIIPLENLIAQTSRIFAEVRSLDEARTAMGILEKGVEGIVLVTDDLNQIKKTAAFVKEQSEPVALCPARVTRVRELGMGDRVCIDTCTSMGMGEGMLVGNSSAAMFLVHAESIENPYVAPRPFRVNAGGVHAYTLLPGGKTRYLSELKTGEDALIVRHDGVTQPTIVGRAKIEKRPMLLIEAEAGGKPVSLILQNAETIRLMAPGGTPVSVVELREGSEVIAYLEKAGRHFGMKVEETITER